MKNKNASPMAGRATNIREKMIRLKWGILHFFGIRYMEKSCRKLESEIMERISPYNCNMLGKG